MGLSAAGALIAIGLSLLAQTPRLLARFGLTKFRFDLRARSFTVYGFALLLLGIGFFLAGVPLGDTPVANSPLELAEAATPGDETPLAGDLTSAEQTVSSTLESLTQVSTSEGQTADSAATSSTGAFGGLPGRETPTADAGEPTIPAELLGTSAAGAPLSATSPPTATDAITATLSTTDSTDGASDDDVQQEAATPTAEPPTETPTITPSPTPSPTETVAPSPTPTLEPTEAPTITPSPIPPDQPTATIGVGTSTLWLRRTPGGQNLTLLRSGDTVILLSGHANYSGLLWRQVSTLDGVVGWVQADYLTINETAVQ